MHICKMFFFFWIMLLHYLELLIFNLQQNTEYKKNIETLTTQVNDHNIKASADQQYIQQLICKIKDTEENQNDKIMQYDLEKSSLQGML